MSSNYVLMFGIHFWDCQGELLLAAVCSDSLTKK